MITADGIKSVNERVKKIEVGKKNYVCVAARVAAFRELCPEGTITTDILKMEDGIVLMKTTVQDETGKVLATGMAQEKESSSFINKTSYIENCETSSVGRALGMLGIGSDQQMASAEEVANAINEQNKEQSGTQKQRAKEKPTSVAMMTAAHLAEISKINSEMPEPGPLPESVLASFYSSGATKKLEELPDKEFPAVINAVLSTKAKREKVNGGRSQVDQDHDRHVQQP